MPAKFFECPDGETIPIEQCLSFQGCRLKNRCATLPYLEMIGYDRKWNGVTPSAAGTGPLCLYLKATTDYVIIPKKRAFAALGVAVHNKVAMQSYVDNVLSEERLSDDKMKGIADLLTQDEYDDGFYVLYDYKTWGSYKVTKAMGLVTKDVPILDESGKPVLLKSGKNKGKPKTKKESHIDKNRIDMYDTELQLNRYRIFFESYGFPVSKMFVQAIVRDGGTYIAINRGVVDELMMFPVKRLADEKVLNYYANLQKEVDEAFKTGIPRVCSYSETWEGNRCEKWCEVYNACDYKGRK